MKFEDIFKNEISLIQNSEFKKHILNIMAGLPTYIMDQPSSTTGKYHPSDEINNNGMILHIKRCVVFARELCVMRKCTPKEQDILIAGCLLHDALKMGPNEIVNGLKVYTDSKHPIYIFSYIKKYVEDNKEGLGELAEMLAKLAMACLYHEGQWTIPESIKTAQIKQQDTQKICDYMHEIDFYASRRSIYLAMQKVLNGQELQVL